MANKNKTSKTSKGERNSVAKRTVNSVRQNRVGFFDILNKFKALESGFNPKVLVPNPDPKTNRREPFIKTSLRDLLAYKPKQKI